MKKTAIYTSLFIVTLFISVYYGNQYISKIDSQSNKGYEERIITLEESEKNLIEIENDIYKTLYLAGGCFWCIEGAFDTKDGVISAVSGYTGGLPETANYKDVSTGDTAHREAVKITYNPDNVSIDKLLDTFFIYIDPYDQGGQFADRGYHYTTAIYYRDEEQKSLIESYINTNDFDTELLATRVLKIEAFFEAEEEHQDYAQKQSGNYQRYFQGSGRKDYVEESKITQ